MIAFRRLTGRSSSHTAELCEPITCVRDTVCATLRIWKSEDQSGLRQGQVRWNHAIVGTAWCIAPNRYLATAFHTLNSGNPRRAEDRFFVFAVPANGQRAYHTRVVGFPLERPDVDIAVMEISPTPGFPVSVPALPVTFERPQDGERVLTYGFPAPEIHRANLDPNGDWRGGEMFLKANANEGIVAANYEHNTIVTYELNVGWHHGESGGPIVRLSSCAAFAIMQRYRSIASPHGVVAGPHQGYGLDAIESDLRALGADVV